TGALALDGSASNGCIGSSTCSASLSTNDVNDLIVVWCSSNPGPVSAPSDSQSKLTWTQRGSEYSGNARAESVYYAIALGAITSDTISCNYGGVTQNIAVIVTLGINGANLVTPFDP